jgi:hypothetical protein
MAGKGFVALLGLLLMSTLATEASDIPVSFGTVLSVLRVLPGFLCAYH